MPEALCAIFAYWGKSTSVPELALLGRQMGLKGMVFTGIPPLARRKGFKVTLLDGSITRIRSAIDRGVPPLIGAYVGVSNFHAFVPIGYSDRERMVLCEDYQDTKRLIPYDDLEEAWRKSGHLMIELEPSGVDDLVKTAVDREGAGRWKEAEALYRKALEAEAQHPEALLGLGNCLYFLGKAEAALAEYRKALALNPADPKLSNNVASVLAELGRDLEEAERLSEQAVDQYREAEEAARRALEREAVGAARGVRQREHKEAQLDLAEALGTLGQVRAARSRHDLALAAWQASYELLPLTSSDARTRRLLDMALSHRAAGMPVRAKELLERALREVLDPKLKARVEAELSK